MVRKCSLCGSTAEVDIRIRNLPDRDVRGVTRLCESCLHDVKVMPTAGRAD